MFFTNATTNQYSILECQPITPMVLEKPIKWNSNHIEVVAPNCPRCASSKTKFCYYNNYSLSQPRYFCKACRRYWTKGGSLRNVPVGGGCRKRSRGRSVVRQGGGTNCPNNPDVGPTNESENGKDIDLAAVFAKYVNPNNEIENSSGSIENFENVEAGSLDIIYGARIEDVSATFEYGKSIGFINGDEDELQELLPQLSIQKEVGDQHLFYQDSVSFELQGVLDELDKELVGGTNLANFGCYQPSTEQSQDFGLFSGDEQLRFPATNSVSDSWDSFDLSAYETFSRP